MQQPPVIDPGLQQTLASGGSTPPVFLRGAAWLGSLKLTLALLVLLVPAIVLAYNSEAWRSWPLALPLTGLALNLLAALASNPAFRRQTALIVFHLALVALLLLIAAGRMSYLKGTLELTEGAWFEGGALTSTDAARWHMGDLDRVRFTNLGFTIDYAPGVRRDATRNRVGWIDERGRMRESTIGDQHPLVVEDYRFYTSFNKGFAPTFTFTPTGGEAILGAVHLPSYPIHQYEQTREWALPGTRRMLWILLDFDETILDPAQPSAFRMPSDYRVIVRDGAERWELRPGAAIDLPEGRLELVGLRSWMGYNVFYDWTLPWLAATAALAVLSLGWHFAGKFRRKAWDA